MKQEEASGPGRMSLFLLTPSQAEGEFAEFSLHSLSKVSFELPTPTAYGQLARDCCQEWATESEKLILKREVSDQKP